MSNQTTSKARARRTRRAGGTGCITRRTARGVYYGEFTDASGTRVKRSTRTTDKAVASRILQGWMTEVAEQRCGLTTAADRTRRAAAQKPVLVHLDDFIRYCRESEQNERAILQKDRNIRRWIAGEGISMLADIEPESVARHLAREVAGGKSARTYNFKRAAILAFTGWLAGQGRLAENPLGGKRVPRRDEQADQRRVRRDLTDGELGRLLEVAKPRGRWLWYALAVRPGLRKGDLRSLRWRDLDLEEGQVEIRNGKAKRTDLLPLDPTTIEGLRGLQAQVRPAPSDRVFPTTVTDQTRLKDFERAGLARWVPVVDASGEPVWTGTGKRRRQRMKLTCIDDAGLAVDLHALRSTFCTQLIRADVPLVKAQKLLRHADPRTTVKHYSKLNLNDLRRSTEQLPPLPSGNGGSEGAPVPALRRA